jgi:hypothetical protein
VPTEHLRELLPLQPRHVHIRNPALDLGFRDPMDGVEGCRLLGAGGERVLDGGVSADERPDRLHPAPQVDKVALDPVLIGRAVVVREVGCDVPVVPIVLLEKASRLLLRRGLDRRLLACAGLGLVRGGPWGQGFRRLLDQALPEPVEGVTLGNHGNHRKTLSYHLGDEVVGNIPRPDLRVLDPVKAGGAEPPAELVGAFVPLDEDRDDARGGCGGTGSFGVPHCFCCHACC